MEIIPELTLFLSMAAGFLFFRKSFGALTLHNPAALFFLGHVLLLGLGGLYRSIYAEVVPINEIVIYLVAFSLSQYAAGAYLATIFFSTKNKIRSAIERSYFIKPLAYSKSGLFIFIVTTTPFLFSLAFSIKAGGLVWLMDDMDNARMEIRRGLGVITLLGIASSFVSSMLLVHHIKPNLLNALIAITFFSFLAGSYGNRAPAGFVFISSLYYYFTMKQNAPKALFILISASVFSALMALNIIRQGLDASLASALQQILWRPFVNFQNLNIIYENFYLQDNIQYGFSYLRDLAIFIPGIHQNNAEWIKEHLNMSFSGGGLTITYIGELLLNFSIAPLFAAPFFLGVLLQALFIFMLRFHLSILFMLIVSFSTMAIVSSGLIPPAINMLAPMIIIYAGFTLLNTVLAELSKKPNSIKHDQAYKPAQANTEHIKINDNATYQRT